MTSTIRRRVQNVIGDRRLTYGTYEKTPSGVGVISDVGLGICEWLNFQGTASPGTAYPTTDFPRTGTAIPYSASSGGIWTAYGR